METTFQRMRLPPSTTSSAVKVWVPSDLPGLAISIGMSNTGTKAWRTKIRFSLPLMKTAT